MYDHSNYYINCFLLHWNQIIACASTQATQNIKEIKKML